jgi:hypothetical protein
MTRERRARACEARGQSDDGHARSLGIQKGKLHAADATALKAMRQAAIHPAGRRLLLGHILPQGYD